MPSREAKLRNAEQALASFLGSGLLALGRTLGPLLWQLPADHALERERIETFPGLRIPTRRCRNLSYRLVPILERLLGV